MDLENQTKESPLDKAKRLRAEKETKDQSKVEAESQAKAEKLEILNTQKTGLEDKLVEINSKIEASRGEAHETRDVMKEGGLDTDESFADEYKSTITEVAGNLNELRNERNKIKAEIESINSNIENFEVNEAVAEGKKSTETAVENVKQENEEAVSSVENYSGAENTDIQAAQEVVAQTNQEVNQVVENSEKGVAEIVGEKPEAVELVEFKAFKTFAENLNEEMGAQTTNEKLTKFLSEKYPKIEKGSEEFNTKWTEIALGANYTNVKDLPYVQYKYKDGLDFDEFKQGREKINEKSALFDVIENTKARIEQSNKWSKEDRQKQCERIQADKKYRDEFAGKFKSKGFNAGDSELVNELFEKDLITIDEVAQGLTNYESEGAGKLRDLSPEILANLHKANTKTMDGRSIPFTVYLDKYADDENSNINLKTKDWPEQTLAYAARAAFATKITGLKFSNELTSTWNDNLQQLTSKIAEKGPSYADSFVGNAGGALSQAIRIDKRLKNIVSEYATYRFNQIGGNNGEEVVNTTVRHLENLVETGAMTREEIDKMYEDALV